MKWMILCNLNSKPVEFGRFSRTDFKPLGFEEYRKGQTANPTLKGNQRDYATINQFICISNMENINAVIINDGIPQPQRLKKLNEIAIQQMRILSEVEGRKFLK